MTSLISMYFKIDGLNETRLISIDHVHRYRAYGVPVPL
jgi:hypothetical protein